MTETQRDALEKAAITVQYYASVCGEDDQDTPAKQALRDIAAALAEPVQEPVEGQCRFKDERQWRWCSVEHVQMVRANPSEWKNYEVRMLYAEAPQPPADVPLLDDSNILRMWHETSSIVPMCNHYNHFARVIEQAVRQKAGLK